MTVDDLCDRAGVTKGAFFHHFASKEALGVAAAEDWSQSTSIFFETAPYHSASDPLDRVMGYIRFRKEIVSGDVAEFTCVVGTMVQEVHHTSPAIRDACQRSMFDHAKTLEADIADAIGRYRPDLENQEALAHSLALHIQAVIQGAFILAKSANDADGAREIVRDQIDHLEAYFRLIFGN